MLVLSVTVDRWFVSIIVWRIGIILSWAWVRPEIERCRRFTVYSAGPFGFYWHGGFKANPTSPHLMPSAQSADARGEGR